MIALFNKSHFSILEAFSRPEQIARKCAELGYSACGIVDTVSVSSAYQFMSAAKEAGIKPIVGCDISNAERVLYVFCANINGWRNVNRILYHGLSEDRIDGLIFVTNKPELFPFVDKKYLFNISDVSSSISRYVDSEDYRYADMIYKIGKHPGSIFGQCLYDIASFNKTHGSKNVNTQRLADLIEPFSLESRPKLPKFTWTDGKTEDEYLRSLCRQGWRNIIAPRIANLDQQAYVDRINQELDVISGAKLAGYFLIVQDYVNWARKNNILVGPGRGSGGGCLISYLTGITAIDPIQHGLLFERFYNSGRNTATKVSLPDIDTDFPVANREDVINYIVQRYGRDNVANMAAFSTLCGRGALKEVMGYDGIPFSQVNLLTKLIVEESKVTDQMEDTGHKSVLSWMLEFRPKILKEYVTLKDNGELAGDYADYFRKAMKIEGTIKAITQHASGIVISADKILDTCPVMNRDGRDIAVMEMRDLESIGLVKVDVLGVAVLDKLMHINILSRKRQ